MGLGDNRLFRRLRDSSSIGRLATGTCSRRCSFISTSIRAHEYIKVWRLRRRGQAGGPTAFR